jgi:HPr kinase/phosphorylase
MEAIRVGALLDDTRFDLKLSLVAGRQGLSRRIS